MTRAATVLLSIALLSASCDDHSQEISGVVVVKPKLAARLKESDTLFVTARQDGVKGGPPLAVLKIVGATYPAHFTLGQSDVVMSGQWFRGKVRLRAQLKRSGFIGVNAPEDLEGSLPDQPFDVGSSGVTIELREPVGERSPTRAQAPSSSP